MTVFVVVDLGLIFMQRYQNTSINDQISTLIAQTTKSGESAKDDVLSKIRMFGATIVGPDKVALLEAFTQSWVAKFMVKAFNMMSVSRGMAQDVSVFLFGTFLCDAVLTQQVLYKTKGYFALGHTV